MLIFAKLHAKKINNKNLVQSLQRHFTDDWFKRNPYKFSMEHHTFTLQPPWSLVKNCIYKEQETIARFLICIESFNSKIGLDEKWLKRLTNPQTSFQTYFEIRILNYLSEGNFEIEIDYPTSKGKDVEALIKNDEIETLIECKVLGLSDKSYNHYKLSDAYQQFITQLHIDGKVSVCGKIEILSDFGQDTWNKLFSATKRAVKNNCGYSFENDFVKFTIVPGPTKQFPDLKTSKLFPSDKRLKSTFDKCLKKLKNESGVILFCCLPMEVGQSGAIDFAKTLLSKNKYKKITQVLFIDPKHTFETEYIQCWSVINPNHSRPSLAWNKDAKNFEVVV